MHDCSQWLSEVESNLPSVVFAVSDVDGRDIPETRVHANGRLLTERTDGRALLLDPGSYTFTFEAAGFVRSEQTLAMRQSEKNRIVRVQLIKQSEVTGQRASGAITAQEFVDEAQPAASGFHIPAGAVVLGAAAVVGAASFAYFGLSGRSKKSDADRCNANCSELIDSGKRDYIIADVSLGVAILSAGSAVLVAILANSGSEDTAHAPAKSGLALGPGAAELRVTF